MKPRERVFRALDHQEADRVPLFEIWIDDEVVAQLGYQDLQSAHVGLGLDCVMIPSVNPEESSAWRDGTDEWGRVWKDGIYVKGVVKTEADLELYSPPLENVNHFFDSDRTTEVMQFYQDHCFIYGSHIGPFTMGYLSMGFQDFFLALIERPEFIHKLLEGRTQWCVAMFQKAASLGVDLLVLGDDAGHKGGPMISPRMWRELILPYHRRIVDQVDVPVVWHSDGGILPLLPMAIEAGFVGVHSLEPGAGMDLGKVKQQFGEDLVLVGNADAALLCGTDLEAVRDEVRRCVNQAAAGGGYMFGTCNSVFKGVEPAALVEMFRYATEIGVYHKTGPAN